ncbi:MAG: gamma-glutamylcyclotransferase family protein [Halobacteriales archaeon]|nr:gamma-glutamylcyclotransferase family protein [Halobacteriales archaeon]
MTDKEKGMAEFIFLYGSLMRGFEMHEGLDLPSRTDFLGEAKCKGTLYDLGGHPGMTLEGNGRVRGELYRVRNKSAIDIVDRHEGYYPESNRESTYVRRLEEMIDRDLKAWVYIYNGPTEGHDVIESGSWRDYLRHNG